MAPKDRDSRWLFQNYALYSHMTVFENMVFALKLRKIGRDHIKRRVGDAAKILEINGYLERRPKACRVASASEWPRQAGMT